MFLSFRSSFNSSTGGVNPTFNSSSPKRSSMSKQQPPIARVLPVNRCDGYIDRYFTFSSPFPSTGVMVVTGTVPAGFFPAVFPRGFFPARSFPRRFFPRRNDFFFLILKNFKKKKNSTKKKFCFVFL